MDSGLTLEKRIEGEIKSFDGTMAVYADDFKGNKIEIRSEEPFETASTIKTYILLSLFEEIKRGNISLTDTLKFEEKHMAEGSGILRSVPFGGSYRVVDLATWMIIVSDNVATNIIIDNLGLDTVNKSIRAHDFSDTVLHNPIDFDTYEKLGTTTAKDYGMFFSRLAKGELIDPVYDGMMMEIFERQHYRRGLTGEFPVYYLDSEDTGEEEMFKIFSKSGSMDACRNDGGIIRTPYGDYVLVLFTKDFSDPLYYDDHPSLKFQAKVSRMLFDQYLALEGSFIL